MPLFVLIGRDGADGVERRKIHRAAHLENLERTDNLGRLFFAGPLKDRDGTPRGSVVIFEAESHAAAEEFVARDPYMEQGVFAQVEVFETARVFPKE
jgi:uncharacterized protein YciI